MSFLALAAGILAFPAAAQEKGDPLWDPYTSDEPEVRAAAGYERWGDFMFASHRTGSVTETLGGKPIRWVETKHFRIGSDLPECPPPYLQGEEERFEAEIERLREKLPEVPKKIKRIDPWLRTHLLAQRAEDAYARFLADFGLDHASAQERTGSPYLGRGDKFLILATEKDELLVRYTSNYTGRASRHATHHSFEKTDQFFLGASFEGYEKSDQPDTDFTAIVQSGLYEVFVSAYRRPYQVPWWFVDGLRSRVRRGFNPRLDMFAGVRGHASFDGWWRWQARVHAHVEWDLYRPFPEGRTLRWDADELDIVDALVNWSRVDYLLRERPARTLAWLDELKKPVHWNGEGEYEQYLAEHARAAMLEAFGETPQDFEAAWRDWVLAQGRGDED